MKKYISYIGMAITSFLMLFNGVYAAGYSISTTSNSITIGNTSTLNVIGNGITGKFTITSSDGSVASVSSSSVWIENNTQSITISSKKIGSTIITITPNDISDSSNGSELKLDDKKITITVKAKPVVVVKPKSSNSYLTSLSIDGYELDKKFDKENLEYSVSIKAETEKIKINAQLADSSARVVGVGEVNVTEGLNTLNIEVTAENGSKRTYILKATVLELDPIKVTVNKEEYTVVRKKKDLPKISDYFTEKDVTIGKDNVPGYYNEKLGYNLVGLKNSKGDIKYFIYKDGKYSEYMEYTFNGTTLQIVDKAIDGYKKTSFVYDSGKIISYQEVKLDILKNTYALDNNEIDGNQFYLFYAKNVENGKEYLYQYDNVEKTVQRYNTLVLDVYKKQSDTYYMCLLGGILILGIVIVTFSTIIIVSKKNRRR